MIRRLLTALFNRTTLRRLLAVVVVVVAAVWSWDALTNLAQFLGFGHLSWMFPLCIDAVAAIGMDYWMTRSPAWRAGRAMALTAICVSLLGNVVDWVLRDVHPLAPWFGAIPPAALAWVLAIMHRNARGVEELVAWLAAEQEYHAGERAERERLAQERAERRSRTAPARPREIEPRNVTELSQTPQRPQLPSGDEERVRLLVEQARETGKVPTKREVQALLQVGSGPALRLTRTVREIVETTETVETDREASA
jgi:hypothetical protein